MITLILLVIIYLAFISLGLPDSLLGVAWPAMQSEWRMPIDAAGLIAMLITGSTIISSLLSVRIIKKLGTGKVTFISCLMTSGALLGFSYSSSYYWLLLFAIPLGLGGGSVDTALNSYVALHFKAHHMNWLHSFWGVGATLGPLIMAQTLSQSPSWRIGYRNIGGIQLTLAIFLFLSLPLWTRHQTRLWKKTEAESSSNTRNHSSKEKHVLRMKGVKYALAIFLFYCATELSVGLWGSSFLVRVKNIPIKTAASWVAMYYGGITIGRFICGFISFKLSNTQMIRLGINIALLGTILLLLPLPNVLLIISLILIGLGLSPIFPAMIHETPNHFGKDHSQAIIGYQMASGYMGSAFLPPLIGVIIKNTTMTIFPFFLVLNIIILYFCSEKLLYSTKEGF